MSEPPCVVNLAMDCADSESRPVLGPAGNKTRSAVELRKPAAKPKVRVGKPEGVKKSPSSVTVTVNLPLRSKSTTPPQLSILKSNLSMNASCSSDASSDSSHSRASTGKVSRRSVTPKQSLISKTGKSENALKTFSKIGKVESVARGGSIDNVVVESDSCLEASGDGSPGRKRCAWVTANTGIIRSRLELNDMLNYHCLNCNLIRSFRFLQLRH